MIEVAFKQMLTEFPTVTAFVVDRVYPVKFPQSCVFPAMTYSVRGAPREYTQDGANGITPFRFEILVRAETYIEVCRLRTALMLAISGLTNHRYAGASPAITLQAVFVENEFDTYDEEQDRSGPETFTKSLDVIVTADQP